PDQVAGILQMRRGLKTRQNSGSSRDCKRHDAGSALRAAGSAARAPRRLKINQQIQTTRKGY
ncbi:MAG: hypothetical protein WBM40_11990, partial [Thiohalocapsa sp.]